MSQEISKLEETYNETRESINNRYAENKEEKEECVNFLLEKISFFKDFKQNLAIENIPDDILKYIYNIDYYINILNKKIEDGFIDKINLHANSHFCDKLGNFITTPLIFVKSIEKGKTKFIDRCKDQLEEYSNYFMLCAQDDNYFKEELGSKNGLVDN